MRVVPFYRFAEMFSLFRVFTPVSADDPDLLGGLEDDGLRCHEVGDLQAGALRRLVVAERNIAWYEPKSIDINTKI